MTPPAVRHVARRPGRWLGRGVLATAVVGGTLRLVGEAALFAALAGTLAAGALLLR